MTTDRADGTAQQVASQQRETQQRVTLPPSVMASIKVITSDATMAPEHRLLGVLVLVWGYAWFELQASIDPRAIALPEAQWLQVCELFTSGVKDDEINGVNLGLSWMNQGPSVLRQRFVLIVVRVIRGSRRRSWSR